MIPKICECEVLVRVVRVVLASISALFISSGSVAIATAWKTTKGLMRAAFVLSMLSSLVAFGLLILFAKVCDDVANHGRDFAALGAAMFGLFVGVPALIMFIVATISAAHSGKVVFGRDQPTEGINLASTMA